MPCFHLVLCDVHLPGISGVDVLKEFRRALGHWSHTGLARAVEPAERVGRPQRKGARGDGQEVQVELAQGRDAPNGRRCAQSLQELLRQPA